MKKSFSFLILNSVFLISFSQDTITVQSGTAGTFELITTDTLPAESEYDESAYVPTGGGQVIILISGTETQRITNKPIPPVDNFQITIYPNPGKGIYAITVYNKTIRKIEIASIVGETIQSSQVNDSYKLNVDISALAKGIYFVKVYLTDGSTKTEKVIFQ